MRRVKTILGRLAQLEQRTNQFNLSLSRYDEAMLREIFTRDGGFIWGVRVKDRFGDYGLVGSVHGQHVEQNLSVSGLILSCRALGRGVEHRILAHLGEMCVQSGFEAIDFMVQRGERNDPALTFIGGLTENPKRDLGFRARAKGVRTVFSLLARDVAELTFNNAPKGSAVQEASTTPTARAASRENIQPADNNNALGYEFIAHNLNSAQKIVTACNAHQLRARAELGGLEPIVAPSSALEKQLAQIWSTVLGVSPIGAQDKFLALGGKSLHLVRIHAQLVNLGYERVQLAELFQVSTVAGLAQMLQNKTPPSQTKETLEHEPAGASPVIGAPSTLEDTENTNLDRAKMRAARMRAARVNIGRGRSQAPVLRRET